jgi:hypothetical protein
MPKTQPAQEPVTDSREAYLGGPGFEPGQTNSRLPEFTRTVILRPQQDGMQCKNPNATRQYIDRDAGENANAWDVEESCGCQ